MVNCGLIVLIEPVLDVHHGVIISDVTRKSARSLIDSERLAIVYVGERSQQGRLAGLVRSDDSDDLVVEVDLGVCQSPEAAELRLCEPHLQPPIPRN